jgi:GR25 family glycosyltransferase involved in LPS biosynthesis
MNTETESLSEFYDKIYVIHYSKYVERKKYLEEKFLEYNIFKKIEWVSLYETEEEQNKLKNPFNINKKVLAVNMSHVYCYQQQLKKNYKNILILEDDVDFQFLHLIRYLNQAADEFIQMEGDIAFLGSCCDLKPQNIKPPQLLYYDPSHGTKSCNAYIVNIKCTQKLIDCMINFHAIDIVFNQILPYLKIKCLWSGLELKQGSETGKYVSSFLNIRDELGNYKNET